MTERMDERLEDEKVEEVEWAEVANTKCKHHLVPAMSDPNSNMWSVQCNKCPHGASYDPSTHELKDGKLLRKEAE